MKNTFFKKISYSLFILITAASIGGFCLNLFMPVPTAVAVDLGRDENGCEEYNTSDKNWETDHGTGNGYMPCCLERKTDNNFDLDNGQQSKLKPFLLTSLSSLPNSNLADADVSSNANYHSPPLKNIFLDSIIIRV